MGYTIVDEEDELHPVILNIRAVISTRSELQELIEKLTRRLETDFAQEETQLVRNEPLHSPDAPWIDDASTGGG